MLRASGDGVEVGAVDGVAVPVGEGDGEGDGEGEGDNIGAICHAAMPAITMITTTIKPNIFFCILHFLFLILSVYQSQLLIKLTQQHAFASQLESLKIQIDVFLFEPA
jgi:hypothetical protein